MTDELTVPVEELRVGDLLWIGETSGGLQIGTWVAVTWIDPPGRYLRGTAASPPGWWSSCYWVDFVPPEGVLTQRWDVPSRAYHAVQLERAATYVPRFTTVQVRRGEPVGSPASGAKPE